MANERDGAELFLLDGNSLAYRAFFALPDSMATTDGRPTNAIFGLASMLVKLITEYRPSQIIVAWDAGMSGREKVYPDYKAHRPPKPDLLRDQWPGLIGLVEAFGYTNVEVEGYEADDVIASLAAQAEGIGIETVVVTGDRDAFQLVRDGVRVMTTTKGITETKMYDADGVKERYGVTPAQVPDLIGLRGDTSDNIPGVPGIGEKTAAALLEQFGSLDAILDSIDEVSGKKRKENLENHSEDARVSRELATMVSDLDTGVDLTDEMDSEPDRSGLREYMLDFELRAALERLEKALGDQVPTTAGDGADRYEAEKVEIAGDDPATLDEVEIAFACDGAWAAGDGTRVVAGFGPVADLASSLAGRPIVVHDAKKALGGREGAFAALGDGKEQVRIDHDTLLAAYLLQPNRRGYEFDELLTEAGIDPGPSGSDGQMSLETGDAGVADLETIALRALNTGRLADTQRPRLQEFGLDRLLAEVEIPLVPVLDSMERIGVRLDPERLAEVGEGVGGEIAEAEAEIHRLAGREFTIGSPQQVGQVLFEELGLTRKRKGKTGYSTDARVLAQIRDEHEIVPLIERWRELSKLKSTYLDTLPGLIDPSDGRIHTTFHQTATATGRLSSTGPNLQNIPVRSELGRPIRGCFVAADGNLLTSADYSQVELRVLAAVADDDVLKGFFQAGQDVHTATAAQVFDIDPDEVDTDQRSKAKMVNFGIIYGLTGFGLADRLNIPRAEGDEFVSRYLERFPAVREFRERVVEEAESDGYVTTLLGRRRPIPELRSDQPHTRQLGERLAVNAVVQGTAADIMKVAMIGCHRALAEQGLETKIILQIHDELLLEGPAEEAEQARDLIVEEMIGAAEIDPALEVEAGIGPDWLSVK